MGDDRAPLTLDSKAPKGQLFDFARNETRFRMLMQKNPARAKALMAEAQTDVRRRFELLARLAEEN